VRDSVQLPTEIAEAVILPELTDPLDVDNLAAAYLMTVVEDSDDVLCAIDFAMMMEGATAESEALEPSSLAEARRRPNWLQWEAGIKEELATLQAAGTWELVDIPRGVRLSEGRGQNNQQPTPNDNNKRVVVFLCGSGR